MTTNSHASTASGFRGNDRILFGIIFGLLSFWLFAMTVLNVKGQINRDLGLDEAQLNLSISITSLVSGLLIVVLGGLADRFGRVRLINWGFWLGFAGSLFIALTPAQSALSGPVLILGRIFQGLGGACIMPASLALLNVYWKGKGRQRAVSLWSMGTWGGTSFAALVGGFVADSLGWRAIFFIAALFNALGYLLVKGTPESKAGTASKERFDYTGFILFMVFIVAIQLYVNFGTQWGWLSPLSLVMVAVSIVSFVFFLGAEKKSHAPFIDLGLFRNSIFTGATISNFLLNATAGVIVVALSVLQEGGGKSAEVAGYLTVGYGVAILLFIPVGEKLLQKFGARKPMLWGIAVLVVSVLLLMQTQRMTSTYMWLMLFAFVFFGMGLAFYATPSTDAALTNLPVEQSGSGSGIYKMASSLGAATGLAISQAIYASIKGTATLPEFLNHVFTFVGRQDNLAFRHAAIYAMIFNLLILVLAFVTILLTVPDKKPSRSASVTENK